jgi:hypothetical protein
MILKRRGIYSYNIILLDFVHGVTEIQTLTHYVSDAGCASVFRQETLKMLDNFRSSYYQSLCPKGWALPA